MPGFRYLPFNDVEALKSGIARETVAILLEPIQGEGGVNVATPEFLHTAVELCKEHDLLLFFDEVQAGFGRCGDLMAWRRIAPEVEPDGISWAKGMGGGIPIGSFWLSDRSVDDQGASFSSLMGPGSMVPPTEAIRWSVRLRLRFLGKSETRICRPTLGKSSRISRKNRFLEAPCDQGDPRDGSSSGN